MIVRSMGCLAACLLVAACGSSPLKHMWPRAPENVSQSFGLQLGQANPGMDLIKSKFDAYLVNVTAARTGARNLEWGVGDGTFFGSVAAVIGGLADRTGLLNTGALVAGGGLAASDRYKPATQADLYGKAITALECMQPIIGGLTESHRQAALNYADAAIQKDAADAPKAAIENVDAVRQKLLDQLDGIRPSAPSGADITGFFDRYKTKTTPPPVDAQRTAAAAQAISADFGTLMRGAGRSTATSTPPAFVNESIQRVKAFSAELERCTKT